MQEINEFGTTFSVCGPFLVVVRKGCGVIGESRLIICDIEYEFPWYLDKSWGWCVFCKS